MSFARKIARRRARLIAFAQRTTIRVVWHSFKLDAQRQRARRRAQAAGAR